MTLPPYREDLVYETNDKIRATYAEANQPVDAQSPIWIARTQYDACAGMSWAASEAKHLAELRQALGLAPLYHTALPLLRTRGPVFYDGHTQQLWKWRGVSGFTLFEQYLRGRDIAPYCQWAASEKISLVRVFGMYCGKLGRLVPPEYPQYYHDLDDFLALVGTFGLSVEFVVFADMGTDPLRTMDAGRHYHDVADVLVARSGCVSEVCNEPFVNGFEPLTVYTPMSELAQALGHYNVDGPTASLPHAQYVTQHGQRDSEWPRRAKDLLELSRLGYSDDPNPAHPPFLPLNVPCVGDEPMGIGPEDPGRRSMIATDHAAYHALAMLVASGSTIHGDFGLEARVPRPEEQAVVDAIVAAWDAIPAACQTWTYTAQHLSGCPLQGDRSLKTYGMMQGTRAVMVRVRGVGDPVATNGWRIIAELGHPAIVVTLER